MRVSLLRLFLPLLIAAPVHAADPSAASAASIEASAQIVAGSAELIVAGAELTLVSIERVGAMTVLVLRGASGTVRLALKLTAGVAEHLTAAAGSTIDVVAASAGHVLIVAGERVAFVLSPQAASHRHRRRWP